MKKQQFPSLLVLVLALIAAVGSQTFLGPCVHGDGSFAACHWACRAVLGEACLLAALALLALALPWERAGLCLAQALTALLGALTPGTLIALCKVPTMRCRMLTRPATIILFAAMLLASLVGWLLARKEAR